MNANTGLLNRVAEKASVADSVATLVHGISNLLKRAESDAAKGQVSLTDEVTSLRKWLTKSSSSITDAISANTIEKNDSASASTTKATGRGKQSSSAQVIPPLSTPEQADIVVAKQPKATRAKKVAPPTPASDTLTAETPKVRRTGKTMKAAPAVRLKPQRKAKATVAGEGSAPIARKAPGTRASQKRAA